jgi:hypothetical protein
MMLGMNAELSSQRRQDFESIITAVFAQIFSGMLITGLWSNKKPG